MAKKRVKLIDIANALDVSVGLVSLVLSGKGKENRISDSLSKKVIEKANELGYQTNQMARGLRTGKSGIIGLVVADIANPYFGKMARFIENEASKSGYQVMFGSSDEEPNKLRDIINVFLTRQVDGLVIVPVKDSEQYLLSIQNQQVPFVFIDRFCEGMDVDYVCTDNFEGAYQLTNLLINKGYKKIAAFVYDLTLTNNIERIKGYESCLRSAGLNQVSEGLVYEVGFKQMNKKLEAAIKLALKDGCDAFFFANNKLGVHCLKYFSDMNISIPNDIGIVSFDNPEVFHISSPGITCYEQPIEEMSARAISALLEKLEGKCKVTKHTLLLPGNLIVRNSC